MELDYQFDDEDVIECLKNINFDRALIRFAAEDLNRRYPSYSDTECRKVLRAHLENHQPPIKRTKVTSPTKLAQIVSSLQLSDQANTVREPPPLSNQRLAILRADRGIPPSHSCFQSHSQPSRTRNRNGRPSQL